MLANHYRIFMQYKTSIRDDYFMDSVYLWLSSTNLKCFLDTHSQTKTRVTIMAKNPIGLYKVSTILVFMYFLDKEK